MLLIALPLIAAAQGKITFHFNRDGSFEIYVMDADGMNQTRLTNNLVSGNIQPALNPNGNQIVFSSFHDFNSKIYVIDSNENNQMNLSNNSASNSNSSLSPDFSRQKKSLWIIDGNNTAFKRAA